MKQFPIWGAFLCLAAAASAWAETPANLAPKSPQKAPWVFSLLPKSLQKNPFLNLTVITEMTEEGKKLPLVTPDHPAFYLMQSGGYHRLGDNGGNKKPLPAEEVERLLTGALASSGYRASHLPDQPPSVAIFYVWGTHNLLHEGDSENPALSPNQIAANLLERARLVGGEKFSRKMLTLFEQADDLANAANVHIPPDGQPPIDAGTLAFMNPVNLFKMESRKNEALLDQTTDDIYYVVASAYDYRALASKQRKLLWRTSMTVASNAVSEEETIPTLIASAAPYLGREMAEPETLTKRAVRSGQIEIGTPTVVEPAPGKPAEKK